VFRATVVRTTTGALRGVRGMASTAASAEAKREKSFVKHLKEDKSPWPIIGMTSVVLCFGAYSFYHYFFQNPAIHLNKDERHKLDYLENDKDPSKAKAYAESAMHQGPQSKYAHLNYKDEIKAKEEEATKKDH
jgi:hypothetical protein